jgi:small-conductance mechanosensitive channel
VRALRPKLIEAIQRVPRVLEQPQPGVELAEFAADGMNLSIGFWIGDPENGQGGVRSDVNLAVLDLLNAEGIQIPFPQRVLHALPAPSAPSAPAAPSTPPTPS